MNKDRLRALTNFPAVVGFLSRDLGWAIDVDAFQDVNDLAFEYTPAELGIEDKYSAKITRIRQLRNMVEKQPWGVFYLEFEARSLPVTVLRRILTRLTKATEKRRGWDREDLLFICVLGSAQNRGVAFAHFRQGNPPELRTFSWDSRETHFYYLEKLNLDKLKWVRDETDHTAWRNQWQSAFTETHRATIQTSEKLAHEMAVYAREIREIIEDIYEVENRKGALHRLFDRFRKELLHDLTPATFADVIAQTVTYGLFSAAEQNPAVTFEQVVEFIPKTNPFLKDLLQALIDDPDLDLAELGIDRLIQMLRAANVPQIAQDFMRQSGSGEEDPVIHFYEQFLNEYDRQQRVERGVFYTPNPVVSYIVRSVDYLLREEFGITEGLASADKAINPATGKEEHLVQVLDPATGTGTFLQYIIEEIAQRKNPKNDSTPEWNRYVAEDLLPRLNGFELMMAPYTVAHMKLGLKLEHTGYRFEHDQRLRVFLTNALDKPVKMQEVLLETDYLSREANQAATVKLSRPIMVVIGNPPYSGHSANIIQDDWIGLQDYYTLDGQPLGERNSKWLQDDYVKFIRFGQHRIQQTGAGILAFITNHGYLDNPTFRGMRESLLQTFDAIYVLDLHGNAKKKETAPDGSKDENVFDIMQGVAIGLFIKYPPESDQRQAMARVFHRDLYGLEKAKYQHLLETPFDPQHYTPLQPQQPFHLFIPQNSVLWDEYQTAWKITEVMPTNVLGFQTHRDQFAIDFDREKIYERLDEMRSTLVGDEEYSKKYELTDNRDWNLRQARLSLQGLDNWAKNIISCNYRPFDNRYCYFSEIAMDYPRREQLQNIAGKDNFILGLGRQGKAVDAPIWHLITCTKHPIDANIFRRGGVNAFFLYLYPDTDFEDRFETSPYPLSEKGRRPNLNPAFVAEVARRLGLNFISEGRGDLVKTFGPEDIFHYAYAVFHAPSYRTRYAEFLKMDFPRLPLTDDLVLFNRLVALGADLVALHLLDEDYAAASWVQEGEDSPLAFTGVNFVEGQDGRKVGKFTNNNYVEGRVYLDSSKKAEVSYFEGIEEEVWNFHIGGYQVLYKWLYDRRAKGKEEGRQLTDEDVAHYGQVVAALRETIQLMNRIDQVIEAHGGFPFGGGGADVQAQLVEVYEERDNMDDLTFLDTEDVEEVQGEDSEEVEPTKDLISIEENESATELTQDMITSDLERHGGVEPEIDDPNQRMSIELDDDEDRIQPFDPTKINIKQTVLAVDQLMRRIRDYEDTQGAAGLNLQPDFQRMGGIWNDEKQSRLIESMMIKIPLPVFYVNESEDNEGLWLVIDGLQRLTAMRRFILDKSLKLKKLEFWKEYEGKTFDELPLTLRRRIEETQCILYLVQHGTPHNVKFNIFKRINTGGAPLSGQEIRHALNLGAATELLRELARTEAFRSATDNGVNPIRMTDRECVLRFLVFMEKDDTLRSEYKMRDFRDYSRGDELDSFLNEQLKAFNLYLGDRHQPNIERWDRLANRFERAMLAARKIFGNRAFRKPLLSNRRSSVSKALFEVWAVNLDRCTDEELEQLMRPEAELENKFQNLMKDTDFVISISYSTGDARRVQYRFQKIAEIIQESL